MLDAVLLFAERKQRVLCVCDNKAATQIATARYSASANAQLEERINLFDLACYERDISVRFRWQPRTTEALKIADSLSRGVVRDIPRRQITHFLICYTYLYT